MQREQAICATSERTSQAARLVLMRSDPIMASVPVIRPSTLVVAHPVRFIGSVLTSFRANQGLLLAGAVAYYTLLSLIPLLILSVIALSHFIGQEELLYTIRRYLEWLVPGQSRAIVRELRSFLENPQVVGWLLLLTMIFFSSLAFSMLEKAMSVIFLHRFGVKHRHFLVSALL